MTREFEGETIIVMDEAGREKASGPFRTSTPGARLPLQEVW